MTTHECPRGADENPWEEECDDVRMSVRLKQADEKRFDAVYL